MKRDLYYRDIVVEILPVLFAIVFVKSSKERYCMQPVADPDIQLGGQFNIFQYFMQGFFVSHAGLFCDSTRRYGVAAPFFQVKKKFICNVYY